VTRQVSQYGIKVSSWGSETFKIVIPVENHPQKPKNRLADYHPLWGWGVLISGQIYVLTVHIHIGVVNSGRHDSPHIRKSSLDHDSGGKNQSRWYEYPLVRPCRSRSQSGCRLDPAAGASRRAQPCRPPRPLRSRSNAPIRPVCPLAWFTTRQFVPSGPMAPCTTCGLLRPSAHLVRMRRRSPARPPAHGTRL